MPQNPDHPDDPAVPASPDYILDLSPAAGTPSANAAPDDSAPGDSAPGAPAGDPATASAGARPFLSIHFKCCNIYGRIYMTTDRRAYAGHCPKCAKPARIAIGPTGTTTRFFTAE